MSANQHIKLAKQYLDGARRSYDNRDYRSATILAVMAIEMAGRALLISKGLTRPRSHGALPALIGREFVTKGKISNEAERNSTQLWKREAEFFMNRPMK